MGGGAACAPSFVTSAKVIPAKCFSSVSMSTVRAISDRSSLDKLRQSRRPLRAWNRNDGSVFEDAMTSDATTGRAINIRRPASASPRGNNLPALSWWCRGAIYFKHNPASVLSLSLSPLDLKSSWVLSLHDSKKSLNCPQRPVHLSLASQCALGCPEQMS